MMKDHESKLNYIIRFPARHKQQPTVAEDLMFVQLVRVYIVAPFCGFDQIRREGNICDISHKKDNCS